MRSDRNRTASFIGFESKDRTNAVHLISVTGQRNHFRKRLCRITVVVIHHAFAVKNKACQGLFRSRTLAADLDLTKTKR